MFEKWPEKFWRFNIWLVTGLVVLLGFFYFFPDLQQWQDQRQRQQEADQLVADNQPALEQAQQAVIKPVRDIDQTDQVWGDLSAPVHLIVYTDFDCPFCADFAQTVAGVQEEFGQQVAITLRHYYLPTHRYALTTALAAECAAEQDQFWPMQEKLFANYGQKVNDTEELLSLAKELKLDIKKFQTCLEEEKYKDKILEQLAEAKTFGVEGTPTSFLNKMILPGAYQLADFSDPTGQTYPGLRSLIKKALGQQ